MNPEFQRNLWLEATPFRLTLIVSFLLLVFVALSASLHAGTDSVAIALYWFFAVLWGTRSAALAVVGEIRERTWDSQKVSAIGPVEMVWGKLFGATIHCWVGALICLPFVLAPQWRNDPQGTLPQGAILILLGVFAQAVALLSSLVLIRRRTGNWRLDTFLCQVAGILAAFLFNKLWDASGFFTKDAAVSVSWWGQDLGFRFFNLVSLLAFTAWALVGCWRAMRGELRFTNGPFVWLAWLLYIAIYQAGFEHLLGLGLHLAGSEVYFDASGHVALKLMLAGFAVLASAYCMAFLEPKDSVRLRWLGEQVRAGRLGKAFLALAAWMLSYGAALILGGATAAMLAVSKGGIGETSLAALSPLVVAILGFLTRDIAIFLLASRVGGGKGDFAALAILAALYILLPMILRPIAPQLVVLFISTPGSPLSPVSAWIQGAVAMALALRGLRRNS